MIDFPNGFFSDCWQAAGGGGGGGGDILTDIDDLMVVYSPVCMLELVCEVWGYIVWDI